MKKMIVGFVAVLIAGCGLFGRVAYGAEIELKFQSTYPPAHEVVKGAFEPWFKKLEEQSKGRLKVHFFAPRAIVKENETFEGAEAGLVDIGTSMPGRNPGKFPLTEMTELPFLFPSAEIGSRVTWRLFEQFPEWQKEFKGAKVLWLWVSATAHIATTKKPIKTLEDLKGMKIIGYSPAMMDTIRALGANPLQVSPIDAYLALQRGMADGIVMSHAGNKSLKLFEATKYVTEAHALVIPFYSVMNEKKFENLPSDLKKLIENTSGAEMAKACGKALDEGDREAGEALKKDGVNIFVLPNDEKAKWAKAVHPLYEDWFKKMETRGHKDARKMFDASQQMIKESRNN